ncbi:hypothetical protein PU629_10315 [Pullulanibacillus sp. KACC 23026]|uniref:hypothetical protein n=1 Tax=Pullulanibacillus sp. KACC 23026 TaxID=3028315 RepID=UPI0023B18EFC|nr:hypothetical protein [Pullulanibacillus sp. KACC 23026]WEG14708.1 hypothetical protein PU629_10315 [Pullulanibacillus sp. KACC 23026]
MGIAVFFFMTWLVCTLFAIIQKKLSIVENTFIFLFLLVININFSWIIAEEMKRIKLPTNGMDYTAYLLNRSVIIPILGLILLNIASCKIYSKTLITFAVVLGVSFCSGLISEYFKITHYTRWDLRYDLLYYFVLYLVTYYVYKWFKKVSYNEVESYDSL